MKIAFNKFFKRLPLLILFAMIGGAIGIFLYYYVLPSQQVAFAKVFIIEKDGANNTSTTYQEFCQSEMIVTQALMLSGNFTSNEDFQSKIVVEQDKKSGVYLIGMKMNDPFVAASAANVLAETFCYSSNAPEILGLESAVMINRAVVPEEKDMNKYVKVMIISSIIGFFIGGIIVAIKDLFDDTIVSTGQLNSLYEKPVLGTIPHSDIK